MMDKVVIVTGAGRGIARRVALDFAAQGCRVAVVDLIAERAKNTTKEIESAGGRALSVVCDVRSEASVRDMVEQTVRTWGRVDVLVNAAGGYTLGKVTHELSVADWDMVMDSNLKGTFLCAKVVLRAHDQGRRGPDHQLRLQRGAHLEPRAGRALHGDEGRRARPHATSGQGVRATPDPCQDSGEQERRERPEERADRSFCADRKSTRLNSSH